MEIICASIYQVVGKVTLKEFTITDVRWEASVYYRHLRELQGLKSLPHEACILVQELGPK